MTKKTSNSTGASFTGKVMTGLRTKIRNLDKKQGGAYFDKASALTEARKQCGTTERFKVWLKDPSEGLGYTVGQVRATDRLVSAVKKVPERKLWERLGWYDGVSRLESIPKSVERAKVLEAVHQKRGVLSTTEFKKMLADHAPSLAQRDAVRSDNEQEEKLKKLSGELNKIKSWVKGSVKRYPFLTDTLDDDLSEMLGIRRN